MKRLLGLVLLLGLAYGGYIYYNQSKVSSVAPVVSSSSLSVSATKDNFDNLAAVLGASISNTFENGKELLSTATSGKSEPIINELVSKTTETLKDLPQKQADKIKYEFCRGVVEEYENK